METKSKLYESKGFLLDLQGVASVAQSGTRTGIEIDSILESSIVLSWADVMAAAPAGLLHMEYRTGANDFIEHLTIWSSTTRGHWLLVCEYWTSAPLPHLAGLNFSNGYSSTGMAGMLEFVMEHQSAFLRRPTVTHDVLLQVRRPTEEETDAAKESMREAVQRIGDYTLGNAAQSAERARSLQELKSRNARSAEESMAQEAATNEGMAEKPEAAA